MRRHQQEEVVTRLNGPLDVNQATQVRVIAEAMAQVGTRLVHSSEHVRQFDFAEIRIAFQFQTS